MSEVRFTIGRVRGQGRPRFARGRAYKAAADREYEAEIAAAYLAAGGPVHSGPVAVRVDTRRPLPKARPRTASPEPDTGRPDADNVAKAVLDALNGVAWEDDSQVVLLEVVKHPRERGAPERLDVRVAPSR